MGKSNVSVPMRTRPAVTPPKGATAKTPGNKKAGGASLADVAGRGIFVAGPQKAASLRRFSAFCAF